ncbi:MAG TPA: hypothetical protein VGF67_04750 [Ktedonobacteraceae bacterium]
MLAFQKIAGQNPAAGELLQACAYLSPDAIPEELLTRGAAHWPASLQEAVADTFLFNQMIEDLLRFSLIRRLQETRLLNLHRLSEIAWERRHSDAGRNGLCAQSMPSFLLTPRKRATVGLPVCGTWSRFRRARH